MDIFETKAFKKAAKLFGESKAKEYLTKTEQELKELISTNSVHINEATASMESNTNYQKACEIKSDFTKALNDDLASPKAAINLAATLIRMRKVTK